MTHRLLSGRSLVAGVVGRPVAHSLSPCIHSAWIAEAGLDAAYVPFPIAEDGFERFVQAMRGGVIRGVNVTVPFKEHALRLADQAEPLVRRAGAANVLVFHDDGRIEGLNTDGIGLLQALAEINDLDLAAGPVVVLGAGGAARGAAASLIAAGVPELRIVNRTLARAEALAEGFEAARAAPWSDMTAAFDGAVAVINATAAGLSGVAPLSDLPVAALPAHAVVMDMVYKPLDTSLLLDARARGLRTVDGLSMLIHQAVPSFEAFYGRPPPPQTDVRALCLARLRP